jgi:inorganic pyrophosphatase
MDETKEKLMSVSQFLQHAQKFEVQAYKKPPDIKHLKRDNIAFSGTPLKHPFEPEKVILVADPYSSNTFYYEFNAVDITFVEELPTLVNLEGETISMARIWVKKKSIGVRCTPFLVAEIGIISRDS